MATREQAAGLEGVRDDDKEAGGAAAESPSWMQMAQGDAGFLKGSTRSGGAAPHPNTGDLETSALFPEFTTGEGRQSAQVLGSPEQGFRAPERVTRSLWDPSPRRARFRAPASTAPGQPETCPRPGRAARPSSHPTPESDEGGSEKHCGHKACLLRYADPRDESISAENRGRLLLGLRQSPHLTNSTIYPHSHPYPES